MRNMREPNHNSREDYLEAVLVIHLHKKSVRSVDIARHLNVSKASVSLAVSTLSECGYLVKRGDRSLQLTEAGQKIAESVYERHCFFQTLLIHAGVDSEIAEAEACRMEHTISTDSVHKLKTYLGMQTKNDN